MEERSPEEIVEAAAPVLEDHPVAFGVLFGSHARGRPSVESDVDIAVAFDRDYPPSDRLQLRIDLTVDLIDALGTDDVDVADFGRMRPRVALSALEHGRPIVGSADRLEAERERLQEVVEDDESHEERMERFDGILERLEATL